MKEFYVWGFNKKAQMSGQYFVPETLKNKIQKGVIFFSEHFGNLYEIEAIGTVVEAVKADSWDNVVYYNGKVVGIK